MTNVSFKPALWAIVVIGLAAGCQSTIKTDGGGHDVALKPIVSPEAPIVPPSDEGPDSVQQPPAVLYRSIDLGTTWTPFAKGIPADATLSGIQQAGNDLYVTTDYHGVFRSTADQGNWQPLGGAQLQQLDINCIEVQGDQIAIGTLNRGVLVSNDGGTNWRPANTNTTNTAVRAFLRFKGILYAGTDGGIYQSTDMGDTWTHAFGNLQVLGFTVLKGTVYAATQSGALVCSGAPTQWRSIYQGDALHDIGTDGEYLYAMTIGQQLLKTNNDGVTWQNAQNGITYPVNYYTNELKHLGRHIFSAQWIGIYHSSNNGVSWRKLQGLPDSTAFSTLEITDFGILAGISIR